MLLTEYRHIDEISITVALEVAKMTDSTASDKSLTTSVFHFYKRQPVKKVIKRIVANEIGFAGYDIH